MVVPYAYTRMAVPYAYTRMVRTIRVWLYHMHIRVWYVPYAYGIEQLQRKIDILHVCTKGCG